MFSTKIRFQEIVQESSGWFLKTVGTKGLNTGISRLGVLTRFFGIVVRAASCTHALKTRCLFGVLFLLLTGTTLAQEYTFLSQFGHSGSGNGEFHSPAGVAIDPSNHNIFVVDGLNNRVQVFSSSGNYLSQFGTSGSGNRQFASPVGIAIDPTSHNIVVADFFNSRVQIFNSAGDYLSQFGTYGSGYGKFSYPVGVAVDPTSHNIVVTDLNNNVVQVFNSSGDFVGQFGSSGNGQGQFDHPFGVAIDPTSHNIVVTDEFNYRTQVFSSTGVYLNQFGTLGSGNGQFNLPSGVAIDPSNHNIFVVDGFNGRGQIFSSTGDYLSQFGTSESGYGLFLSPIGVAIDPTSHNIVVADSGNNRVQIFAPTAPSCANAPTIAVQTENSTGGLYGVARGDPLSDAASHALVSRVTIYPEQLYSLLGIGFADGLPFYLSVIPKPDSGVTPLKVSMGAALGFVGPGANAIYDVHFCQPGTMRFDLVLDKTSLLRSIGVLVLGQLPGVGTIDDFVAKARQNVPLFDQVVTHFLNAFSAESSVTRQNEIKAASLALSQLGNPKNADQLAELLAIELEFGVKKALPEDFKAIARLENLPALTKFVKTAGAVISLIDIGLRINEMLLAFDILMTQTGGDLTGPGPMVIRIQAQ